MADAWVVVMALSAAAGALAPRPVPLVLAALVVVGGLGRRLPVVVCLGVALAASGLAQRSWAGLQPPVTGPWSGIVTLAGDPVETFGAVRVDVRLEGKRVEAWARGGDGGRLLGLLAGERVGMEGRVEDVPDGSRSRLARRHVAARMTVTDVGDASPGGALSRLANRLRRTLGAGAASLPQERRSLFTGFVLGDNRGQPAEIVHDFRASGLAHLLVVSGQNVAFILALAAPALARMGLRGRLATGVAVLVVFGTITRWEPSVLRAVGMTSIGLLATTVGRPASSLRLLALAVTGLLLVDPLLVGSLGFLLSVGASTGLALLARPLTQAIPGPRPVATVAGATLAAQAGVAPFLLPAFGGIPSATLVANLLAAPAAGPLMMWGLAAGLPAGLLHPDLARLVHVPTSLLVGWVAGVARVTASLPLGRLHAGHAIAVGALAAVAATARGTGHRRLARATALGAGTVLLLPTVAAAWPPPADGASVAQQVTLWRSGPSVVVVLDGGRASPETVLGGLHAAGVHHVDVLVARRGRRSEAALVETVRRRLPVGAVLAPMDDNVAGAIVPPPGTVVRLGDLSIAIGHDEGALALDIERGHRRPEGGSPSQDAVVRRGRAPPRPHVHAPGRGRRRRHRHPPPGR